MTRALVVEASGNLWGSERALLDLLRAMRSLELVVCCPPRMPLSDRLAKLCIRTLPYYVYGLHEKSRWRRLWAAVKMLRACLEFRPDIIYLNQGGSYKVALPAATLTNCPIVAHVRIFEDAAYLARQNPDLRRLRGIIAISAAVEVELESFPALKNIPIHRLYDAYLVSPPSSTLTPLNRVANRVACVARLVPVKGHDVLVSALALLKGRQPTVECLFVGTGDPHYVEELKEAASKGNVAGIEWTGFVGDVVSLLRTCSVLVCPSYREPLGRVVFEAWDAGAVPVVFAGSGGAAEIVSLADGGILYDNQEPESLADALRCALDLEPAQRARLVNNGQAWMASNCNPETYADAISTILLQACAREA